MARPDCSSPAWPSLEEIRRTTMLAGNIIYRPISALETHGLRRSVLHPDQKGAELAYPSDEVAVALHVGAISSGTIVGIGSVWPSPLPQSIYWDAWRIVGMAVDPNYQKRGIGSKILNHLLAHAAAQNSDLAWCNSREEAVPLYATAGFATTTSSDFADRNRKRVRMTCRLDKINNAKLQPIESDGIQRFDTSARLSRIVVFNNTVHIGGLLPNRSDVSVGQQTLEILEKIDWLLKKAGTNKSRLISAMVWLKDIVAAPQMNEVWEAWVPPGTAPVRACVQSVPGSKDYAVEIAVVAAQPGAM
jgi:enamine deaminase RidA (YjgF/YER057c/UK114 family)/GNAT superfamily N-acetyltransferase